MERKVGQQGYLFFIHAEAIRLLAAGIGRQARERQPSVSQRQEL
jgi:hypothetical protein